jgi:kinesin family protein 5
MHENIQVAIRFRPISKKETCDYTLEIDEKQNIVEITESGEKEPGRFSFDHVFHSKTSQESIFNNVAKNAIHWVCQGYNATIFAYGTTGSGKTFTMFGDEKNKGIIPRSCETIFSIINSKDEVIEANMKCSFLEIYREQIKDLLYNGNNGESLKLRQHPTKGVYVQGLVEKYVYSAEDILNTIKEGSLQRTIACTALNNASSRSHAVLTLIIQQKMTDGSEIVSKLHLIDLAGAENVSKSEVQGLNLTEAQNINKSLSCLGNVICALTEKGREHIPYRDSKLTYLLQDSIGGNSKTILIATASAVYSDTINTLKFAKRAKEIKNIPKINKNESIAVLLQTISNLHKKIALLESKIPEKLPEKELFTQLYTERVKNYRLSQQLERYNLFYQLLKDTVHSPKILVHLIEKFQPIPFDEHIGWLF